MGCRNRNSFRNLLKIINILPLKSQYILTLLVFVVNNNNSQLMQVVIIHIPDKEITSICHKAIMGMVKKDFIIRESEYSY